MAIVSNIPISPANAGDLSAVKSEPRKTSDPALPILTVKISGPLDTALLGPSMSNVVGQSHPTSGSRTLVRRDSLERREAFLKGKEGSRQRRRWENDRLLSNPWAVAPLASDWEVRPTYPTRRVPYYLAPLWDAAEFQRSVEAKLENSCRGNKAHGAKGAKTISPAEEAASNVPKEVRAKLKKARAARGLLQDLEEEVRLFLIKWNQKQQMRERDGLGDIPSTPVRRMSAMEDDFHLVDKDRLDLASDSESDTDEVVFIGRGGLTTHDSPGRKARETEVGLDHVGRDKLVFDGLAADKGAGFARWLVHSIGTYYGLRTYSVTRMANRHAERPTWLSQVQTWGPTYSIVDWVVSSNCPGRFGEWSRSFGGRVRRLEVRGHVHVTLGGREISVLEDSIRIFGPPIQDCL